MILLLAMLVVQDPVIEITKDNTVITRSCRIKPGQYMIQDEDENGVIQIMGKNITVDFQGATLSGAPDTRPRDVLKGIGIHVTDSSEVTIRNARVHGFAYNIRIFDSRSVSLEQCNVSHGKGQRISHAGRVTQRHWLHLRGLDAWRNYGAGIWMEKGINCRVYQCLGRHMQNGIILVGSRNCEVVQNDFCFNSGWGIGLWDSSENRVMSNLADFVNRPWKSETGWGADSAAIVLVNKSNHNWIVGNSFTHSGDGIFLTSQDSIGKKDSGPSNHNLFAYNDGSYSTANAVEATFSEGNQFIGNWANHSRYGFWIGYSFKNVFFGNEIIGNEQDAIACENGHSHWIEGNRMEKNRVGVQLWKNRNDPRDLPNHRTTIRNNQINSNKIGILIKDGSTMRIENNQFLDNELALEWKDAKNSRASGNRFEIKDRKKASFLKLTNYEGTFDARGNAWVDKQGRNISDLVEGGKVNAEEPDPKAGPMVFYKDRGSRMGWGALKPADWAPLNFDQHLVFPLFVSGSKEVSVAVVGRGKFEVQAAPEGVTVTPKSGRSPARITITSEKVQDFPLTITFPELEEEGKKPRTETVQVSLFPVNWKVQFYRWEADAKGGPPGDPFQGDPLHEVEVDTIDFLWAHGGIGNDLPKDFFATRARAEVELPAGDYEIHTVSDDGIRVTIDGKVVLADWTHHAPRSANKTVTMKEGKHTFLIEHFEINGFAQLQFSMFQKK